MKPPPAHILEKIETNVAIKIEQPENADIKPTKAALNKNLKKVLGKQNIPPKPKEDVSFEEKAIEIYVRQKILIQQDRYAEAIRYIRKYTSRNLKKLSTNKRAVLEKCIKFKKKYESEIQNGIESFTDDEKLDLLVLSASDESSDEDESESDSEYKFEIKKEEHKFEIKKEEPEFEIKKEEPKFEPIEIKLEETKNEDFHDLETLQEHKFETQDIKQEIPTNSGSDFDDHKFQIKQDNYELLEVKEES